MDQTCVWQTVGKLHSVCAFECPLYISSICILWGPVIEMPMWPKLLPMPSPGIASFFVCVCWLISSGVHKELHDISKVNVTSTRLWSLFARRVSCQEEVFQCFNIGAMVSIVYVMIPCLNIGAVVCIVYAMKPSRALWQTKQKTF